ncbi:DUF1800 domain-containing protein, partial [Vibrio parahaemolyticus]
RVARVLNNNGKGVKGDLSAVIRAVLLDNESMGLTKTPPMKVKEPILVLTNFKRAAGFTLTAARKHAATTVMKTAE